MAAAFQQRDTREGNTGAKQLSAYQRGLIPLPPASPSSIPNGLSIAAIVLTPAIVPPSAGFPNLWALTPNLRYKFSASAIIGNGNEGQVSLESAGMFISLQAGVATLGNAARLSTTTALAANQIISFDEWTVDCNDMISLLRQASASPFHGFPPAAGFELVLRFVFNQVAGGPALLNIVGSYTVAAAQFDSYRFDKWE